MDTPLAAIYLLEHLLLLLECATQSHTHPARHYVSCLGSSKGDEAHQKVTGSSKGNGSYQKMMGDSSKRCVQQSMRIGSCTCSMHNEEGSAEYG